MLHDAAFIDSGSFCRAIVLPLYTSCSPLFTFLPPPPPTHTKKRKNGASIFECDSRVRSRRNDIPLQLNAKWLSTGSRRGVIDFTHLMGCLSESLESDYGCWTRVVKLANYQKLVFWCSWLRNIESNLRLLLLPFAARDPSFKGVCDVVVLGACQL